MLRARLSPSGGGAEAARTSVRRRAIFVAQLGGVGLLILGGLGVLLSSRAQAASLVSGPVTISTIGTVTAGTPFSSGQVISIAVGANTTMDSTSLANAGFPSGAVAIKALECADPGGLVANLPTKPSECDPNTISSIPGANADGSMSFPGYPVYALPNANTFGESSTSTPACDNGDACVIGLFSNYTDFSKPVIFSAPFYVAPNSDDAGENPGDGSPLAATSVSPTNSTVVASPAAATADGVDSSKVTVTLKDTNGVPVAGGKQVTLSQGSGHSAIAVAGVATATTTTDATTGIASFTVTDTTPEAVTYSATDTTDGVPLSTTQTVTFGAPVVTPANSTITASPTAVASGGTSTITVTLGDQAQSAQPVAGKAVSLSDGSGHATITAVSSTSDAQGQATFTVTDTTNEVATFMADDTTDGIALTGQSASVTFGTLTVSASASTVSASSAEVSSVPSGGILPTGTITVTLLAADGSSAVVGKTVTLSSSSTTAVITPTSASGGTNTMGQATFEVADGTAEVVTFTATDTTDGIPLTSTATVTFALPIASASASTITVSTPTAPADGVSGVTLSVTITDQFGQALGGKVVTVAGSPATSVRVAPVTVSSGLPAGTTDPTGHAAFLAYDTAAETVTFTATDTTDNVVVQKTVAVTYVASVPQVNESTLAASPSTVPADGTTASTVTVTLADHNSNPVSGKAITLTAESGGSVITPISPTTNAQGQATFKVTDSTNEVVFYTATDTTDILPLAGQGVTVTFGTPPPVLPSMADSTIVAEPAQVPADGSTAATVTVVLADANGDAVSGKTVALNPGSGGSTVTTVTGQTDDNGEATFTVTDKTAEKVTYTATDVTDNAPITGPTVTVTFTASTTSGSTSTTTTTPSTTTSTTAPPNATTATSSATTTPTPAAADTGSTDTGSTDTSGTAGTTGNTGSASSSSGTLASTGIPGQWPWIIGLGMLLCAGGEVGRRSLRSREAR